MESRDLMANVPSKENLQAWISALSESEKNAVLLKMLEQDDPLFRTELLKRSRTDTSHQQGIQPQAEKRRTVEELLSVAKKITAEKQRKEAEGKGAGN